MQNFDGQAKLNRLFALSVLPYGNMHDSSSCVGVACEQLAGPSDWQTNLGRISLP